MSDDRKSFTYDDFNSAIEELDNTMQRSRLLATQASHFNSLQTRHIGRCQTTIDKSGQHLRGVEHELDELQKNFCIRLCCSSKSKKAKLKTSSLNNSQQTKLNRNLVHIENDPIHSHEQFHDFDENLQQLQHFNTIINNDIQSQIQILV